MADEELDEKASVTKTEDGSDFSASDYADVGDPKKPSTWKLRVASSPGKVDAGMIARAITALQPGGYRGNPVQIESSRGAAIGKLRTAIGKLDDDAQKKNLLGRLAKLGSGGKTLVELSMEHGHMVGEKCDMCAEAGPSYYQPYGGATSFDEIDAYRATQELSMEVSDLTYQFNSIMSNIMTTQMLTPAEKAAAIAAAAGDFQDRLSKESLQEELGEGEMALRSEKAGRRIGKGMMDVINRMKNDFKTLVSWGNYEDDQAGDGEDKAGDGGKKELAAAAADALLGGFGIVEKEGKPTRWLSISSNAFEDVEGELFSTKAHQDAVAFADATGDRGPLRLFHVPGADIGHTDFQEVVGRMLVESGTFADTPMGAAAEKYFKEHRDTDFGVSIGYFYRLGDEKDATYDWLRYRERSVCPPGKAANPWTTFRLGGLEMNATKQAFLEDVLGKDLAASVIENAETRTKELEKAGIRFKAAGDEEKSADANANADPNAAAAAAASQEQKPADEGAKSFDQETIVAGVKDIGLAVMTLADSVKTLQTQVAELTKSDDERLAAMVNRGRAGEGFRASSASSTEQKDAKLDEQIMGESSKEREAAVAPVAAYLAQVGISVGA